MAKSRGRVQPKPAAVTVWASSATAIWVIFAVLFVAGVVVRSASLDIARISHDERVTDESRWSPGAFYQYLEQDEKIYLALVEQIENGRGYTLQGHPILKEPWLIGDQYRHELFFHPPGGIWLFLIAHRIAGNTGFPIVQVLAFAIFYWSLMWLGTMVVRPMNIAGAAILGVLGCATPLMSQVAGRFWLDGPLLAFSTLAVAVFLAGVLKGRSWIIVAGGLILGYATLIKVTAVLVIPGALLLAWALQPGMAWRQVARYGALLAGVAGVVHLPWLIWQWRVMGVAFPAWAGKPANRLVQTNRYIYFLTVVRTPWTYIELLPQVMFTLTPGILLWLSSQRVRNAGRTGLALLTWIAVVVVAHMYLGSIGYSKLLRYIVLITPAAALLFTLAVTATIDGVRQKRRITAGAVLLLVLAGVGLGLEVTQGLRTALHDNARIDDIRPLFGERGLDW